MDLENLRTEEVKEQICYLFVRMRILPSTSKKMKENLDLYCFVTL